MAHLRSCRRPSPQLPLFSGYACGERKQIPLFRRKGAPIRCSQIELNGGIK